MNFRDLKITSLRLLRAAGIEKLASRSRWRTGRLLILCYHGISIDDEHEWNPILYFSPEQFRARLKLIQDARCHVLPFEDALARLQNETLPERSVTITFDDGGYDFHASALPVLQEFGYPSLVYLTTYYVHHRRPVFALTCSYMMWKSKLTRLPLNEVTGENEEVAIGDPKTAWEVTKRIGRFADMHQLSSEDKFDLARRLAGVLNVDMDGLLRKRLFQMMTHEEAAEASRNGVDLQLHTHRHRTPNDEALFRKEIEDNRRAIEEITGKPARHFCYPQGVNKPEFLPWLRDANVVSATTCRSGLASRNDDPLLLPRLVDVGGRSVVDFRAWLSGIGVLLSTR